MKFKKALIWSYTVGQLHPSLNKKEQTIEGAMPIIEALFPGVDYYSISGFNQVMQECVIPALKKRFPQLESLSAEDIKDGERVEVIQFLPSNGYEWQDSAKWQAKFKKILAVT